MPLSFIISFLFDPWTFPPCIKNPPNIKVTLLVGEIYMCMHCCQTQVHVGTDKPETR